MNENTPVPPGQGAELPAEAGEAFVRRVSAADPARTLEVDAQALRAAVDSRVAVGGVDEVARARARRWTSWPVRVAGVAAAALVVGGGGGYAIGAAGDGTAPASPVITLQEGPGMDESSEWASQEPAVAAGAVPLGSPDAAVMDRSYFPGYGRTVFMASGLSQEGGSARAYAFDPARVFDEESITRVASGLGVSGTAVLQDGYWQVGPNDGTAPSVTLYPDGTASVSYYDPTTDPWSCVPQPDVQPSEGETDGGAGSEPSEGMVAPDSCVQRDLGPAPQGEAAVSAARDVLVAIGVDPAGFELVTENWGDEMWSYVTAYQVVDGQRSGVQWSVSFTGGGLQSLSGSLAPLLELGEYTVISPAKAVERLTDPRFGSSMGPIMYEGTMKGATDAAGAEGQAAEGDAGTSDLSVAPAQPTLPPTLTAGSPLRWPVVEVTITGARLGLALQTQPDGAAVLMPTYELTAADGAVWSVIAVADDELDFSAS